MELTFLTTLPVWVINLALAGLVCARGTRKASHQLFVAFVLALIMWSLSVKLAHFYAGAATGIWWARLAFTGGSLAGLSFGLFGQAFPDCQRLTLNRGTQVIVLLGLLVTACTFTPLVLSDLGVPDRGGIQPHYGPFYPLFAVYLLTAFGYGIWSLVRKWRAARGRSKLQIQYLWLGAGLLVSGAVTTNLLIPALTGSSRFSEYGPYFTLCFVGLTAHAIIRHRLMDIRLVVRQSVTYCLSLEITVGIMWGVLTIIRLALGTQSYLEASVIPLVVGIGGVVLFYPVRVRTQRLLDRYCYREPSDYQPATRTMSQVLAGLVRLTPLCDYLTDFIRSTLKVEMVAVYVSHGSAELEQCAVQSPGGDCHLPQRVSAAEITALLTRVKEPVMYEELERWENSQAVEALAITFISLGSNVLIPLLVEGRLTALIAVGGKLSGDTFFKHDLEFLGTVGHQASVAFRRAQLYEEIAWMKEHNESILRQMGSGVIAINQQGIITMMNATAAQLIGITTADGTGQPIAVVLPTALTTPLQQTLAGAAAYTNEEAILSLASGRTLPIALSTSVLHGAEGEPIGAILVFHDLSRLKELEEEKRRIERLASIGAFVAGIAHEIKNPLVAIKTLAELLPEQYDDEEFRTTFSKVALHEVNRIDALVQRLRSLSSPSPLQMRPISIMTPLDETLELISGELTKRSITLVYEKEPTLPAVMGDHDQLQQVFLNLCLNSLEAMDQDGTLHITVGVDTPRDETPAAVRIQMADTGPGIPAAYFPTIFEPFVTSKATGSGLGLAICKGIIEHHRGTIAAANRSDGPGAVFTVKLPLAQGEECHEVAAPRRRHADAALAVA
jgi:PAS domain S-box-containing protein